MIERKCKVKLLYRYVDTSEAFEKLNKFKLFLEPLGLEIDFKKTIYYGDCWELSVKGETPLNKAEDIYNYADTHLIACKFNYLPTDRYFLVSQ